MRTSIIVLLASAGLVSTSLGALDSRVAFQVSIDGTNWAASVDAAPGSTVYARSLVSYIGTASPLGLASLVYQPTVSNWLGSDTLLPFVGGGFGSNTSTPLGVVTGSQVTDTSSFGRISPWGRTNLSATAFLMGHVHTNPYGTGHGYLRIAQRQTTGWIGGMGNTTGGMGVPISQLNDSGRTTSDPAFNPSISNILVFKFGFTLGAEMGRTMVVDAPLDGFGNRGSTTGERQVYWFATMTEGTGSIRGTAVVETATVNVVPTPGTMIGLGLGATVVVRRRAR